MNELLEWAENAGLENLRFRLQNAETLAKEATSTLTLLLAGMGGALAFAAKGFEQPSPTPLAVGAVALAVWLMLVGCLLVVNCILSTPLLVPTNDPLNLYQKDYPIDALREVELRNIQKRIEFMAARNHRISAWLDRTRLLALASPGVFAIAALAYVAH